jgi:GxxExxY protein
MDQEEIPKEYPLKDLTEKIIGAAVDVHRALGPGFLEKVYENALVLELEARGHKVARQVTVAVLYREKLVGQHRIDLLVDDLVVLELKSVEALARAHQAQLRSTLKAANKRIGLLMNFNQATLTSGIRRVIN